jgi:hypothetical protein
LSMVSNAEDMPGTAQVRVLSCHVFLDGLLACSCTYCTSETMEAFDTCSACVIS